MRVTEYSSTPEYPSFPAEQGRVEGGEGTQGRGRTTNANKSNCMKQKSIVHNKSFKLI